MSIVSASKGRLAALTLLGASLLAVTSAGGHPATRTIRLYEHDTSQATADLGAKGDSPGDLYVFSGDTFTRKGGARVGRLGGTCTTTSVDPGGEQLCTATFTLPGGQIALQGLATTDELFGGRTLSFPITGGTGAYRHARGSGTIQVPVDVPGQTDANFVIHLG